MKRSLREKRKFRRWEIRIPCLLILEQEDREAWIWDLSLGGAGIIIHGAPYLTLTRHSKLVLKIPDHQTRFSGGVRHSRIDTDGIQIVGIEFSESLSERRRKIEPILEASLGQRFNTTGISSLVRMMELLKS